MKKYIYLTITLCLVVVFASCSGLLDPINDNQSGFERVYSEPFFAEGLLMNAYNKIPSLSLYFTDNATDNAVTNLKIDNFRRVGTGQWTSQFSPYPINVWSNANEAIMYLNQFIPIVSEVKWSWTNSKINKMFIDRNLGEAYALRGFFRLQLLQSTAGKNSKGDLLGIPLYDVFLTDMAGFNAPRASFETSVIEIYKDFNKALQLLPMDFKDINNSSLIPATYTNATIEEYNKVFGNVSNQRISMRIVLGLKAKLSILAASPAFNSVDNQNYTNLWLEAANSNAEVLKLINGTVGLDPSGHKFYEGVRVDAASVANDQREMLWRSASNTLSSSLEKRMLPPDLFGNGELNPSQNIVDAFPTLNGYPINNPSSNYDPFNPYKNRDPRLTLYIIYNGLKVQNSTINTGLGGGINAKDSISSSTRTGYYLRKLLREDIIISADGTATNKKHYNVHIRYTEIFLNYAEAANEAWGPDGIGSVLPESARNVIAAIRKRAGITQPDNYLNSISTKENMRELIRNERRLELCFEGYRFWDIRRWGLDMNTMVKGVNISGNLLSYVDVEQRIFKPFMQYGPIPHTEILKFSGLDQNKGW
jgi:hypothetical protein